MTGPLPASAHYHRRLSVAALVNPPSPPPPPSTMQSPRPTSSIIDAHDEKVLIAVSALGDMRGSASTADRPGQYWHPDHAQVASSSSTAPTPSLSHASSSSRTTSPSALTRSDDDGADQDQDSQDRLLARVSNLPLVNSALRAYDYSKANSRVINYGAGLVESSVKTISRPVIDRLPVDQLDEFACRQLDRLGKYGGKPEAAESQDSAEHRGRDRTTRSRQSSLSSNLSDAASEHRQRITAPESQTGEPDDSGRQVQVASRRGWQTVLVEASGISAAISEENMKRLKYCLQWLQYATAHIDQQMAVLQRFLASLDSQINNNPEAVVPMTSMRTLTDVKRDVVATVRQVVEVMSKYAGGALPEQARATVRNIILLLPERWASAMQQQDADLPPGPSTSTSNSELSATTAQRAAKRVLTLATESLEMMRGATGVFGESLDRAEAWVERLRVVGIQRQRQQQHAIGHLPPLAHPDGISPNSPGVNIQGLSLASSATSSLVGSRRPSHSEPDEDDSHTETEGETAGPAFSRRGGGTIRRRQRRRIASPSPAGNARLNGLIPGMQVDA